MNYLSAPYFSLRKAAQSAGGQARNLGGGLTHSPDELNQLLRSSRLTLRADLIDISEVARRRAQGEISWLPAPNSYQQLLDSQLEVHARKQLEQLRTHSDSTRRRAWRQAVAGGPYTQGRPNYNYVVGPDQRLYVDSASAPIDSGEIPGDSQATRRKARRLQSLYLASGRQRFADYQAAAGAISLSMRAAVSGPKAPMKEDAVQEYSFSEESDPLDAQPEERTEGSSFSEAFSTNRANPDKLVRPSEATIQHYQQDAPPNFNHGQTASIALL